MHNNYIITALIIINVVITIINSWRKNLTHKIVNLIKNKWFIINFLIIIIFCIITFTSSNNEELKAAIIHSLLALIVALYAYLDLFIAVFWLIMM